MQHMLQPKNKTLLPLIASGVLTFIGVCKSVFVLGWFCLVPLFVVTNRQTAKQSFRSGFIFGLSLAAISFYWMIPGAGRFTGSSIFYGMLVYLLSALLLAVFFAALLWTIHFLRRKKGNIPVTITNAILAAVLFCLFEYLLTYISVGLPWFDFHAGNGIAMNIWAIQPASYTGVYGLSFMVVFINYLTAVLYERRQWFQFYLPVCCFIAYMSGGYLILQNFNTQLKPAKSFTVNILCENILPDVKWNEENGNRLVQLLLNLNKASVADKADLNLWSESTVPWTYRPDDDFVNEIIKTTKTAGSTTIIGINSDYSDNVVYNSVYCLAADGTVKGRYDKHYLLSFIETPTAGVIFPFLSSGGFVVQPGKEYTHPMSTAFGKAGIIICNEATVPAVANAIAVDGAQFLFNLSNDGWFNDTYIVGLHFINARMRAVETRKDLCINSNNGISGLVRASGLVETTQRSAEPFVKKVTIHPNNETSFFTLHPFAFLHACLLLLVFFTIQKFIFKKQ